MIIKNFNKLPAQFIEVSPQNSSELFTRGKLKVFYVGVTADGREFDEAFSQKLLKTIAYTPVISHYNSEKKDFEGHSENQEIYGLVDPMTKPTIEIDKNGTKWAVCDVIIYDKRPDKTGTIASEIIGHAESLELDPGTIQYEIIRNDKGEFQRIHFTDGKFIGVSVLGKNQEPAFDGAQFFQTLSPSVFRGKEMNLTIPMFVKLSWGEKGNLICKALNAEYGDKFFYIADVYDDSVVYTKINEEGNDYNLFKETYTISSDNATIVLNKDAVQVHASYEEIAPAIPAAPVAQATIKAEGAENAAELQSEKKDDEKDEDEDGKPAFTLNAIDPNNIVVSTEGTATLSTGSIIAPSTDIDKESTNNAVKEKLSDATALSEAERNELEKYRHEEKINKIDTFSDAIPAAELDKVKSVVDDYTIDEITNKLNSLFVQYSRQKKAETPSKNGFHWFLDNEKTLGNADEIEKEAHVRDLLK